MKDKMMNTFLEFATKIQGQRHINAIKNGFTNLMLYVIPQKAMSVLPIFQVCPGWVL